MKICVLYLTSKEEIGNVCEMRNTVDITTTYGKDKQASLDSGSPVLNRALDVLLAFAGSESDLGVSEISRSLSIDKAQVYRYLMALRNKGFVSYQQKTRRYFLGMTVLQLSRSIERKYDLNAITTPFLERMRDLSGETCGFATRVGKRRTHLLQMESNHEIRQRFPIGASLPMHLGAAGICLVAFSEYSRDNEYLLSEILGNDNQPALVDLEKFDRSIMETRERGYGSSLGDRVPGSRSIAAPVWSLRGDLFALVVSGPSFRFTEDKVGEALVDLKKCAAELTATLGGHQSIPRWSVKELLNGQ